MYAWRIQFSIIEIREFLARNTPSSALESISIQLTHVAYLPMELWPGLLKPCRLLYQVSVDGCFLDRMENLEVLTEYCMSSGEAGVKKIFGISAARSLTLSSKNEVFHRILSHYQSKATLHAVTYRRLEEGQPHCRRGEISSVTSKQRIVMEQICPVRLWRAYRTPSCELRGPIENRAR